MTEAMVVRSVPSVSFSIMEATVRSSWMVYPLSAIFCRMLSSTLLSKFTSILLMTYLGSSPM